MRRRLRLSPAALRRVGSDIPTQAALLTYTSEGVLMGGPYSRWILYVSYSNVCIEESRHDTGGARGRADPDFGLCTILSLPILYGVWHTKEGWGGLRVLRNRCAIVLQ